MTVVCPTVCPVPEPKSKTEGRWKLKIDKKEAHDTTDLWPHLEVEMSKVKVTRLLNAMTENQLYLRNGKAYELQTWYTDGVRWPASPTCAMTSKLRALSGCSSHRLEGAGHVLAALTTGRTACQDLGVILSVNCVRKMK